MTHFAGQRSSQRSYKGWAAWRRTVLVLLSRREDVVALAKATFRSSSSPLRNMKKHQMELFKQNQSEDGGKNLHMGPLMTTKVVTDVSVACGKMQMQIQMEVFYMVLDVNTMGFGSVFETLSSNTQERESCEVHVTGFVSTLLFCLSCSPLKGLLYLHVLECEATHPKQTFYF